MKKKNIFIILGIVLVILIILIVGIFSTSFLSVTSVGGKCERYWSTTKANEYYLRCYVSYQSSKHCDAPLVVEFKDNTEYFTSLSSWEFRYGGETCKIVDSHDTYVKFECGMPKDRVATCEALASGDLGYSGFSVSTRIDLKANLDYNACSTFLGYLPIGERACGKIVCRKIEGQTEYPYALDCSPREVQECTGKNIRTTIEVCDYKCEDERCIDYVACSADSDCPNDGYVGEKYCLGNKIMQKYGNYSCTNNKCSYNEKENTIESCPFGCTGDKCNSGPQLPPRPNIGEWFTNILQAIGNWFRGLFGG